jgi:glutamate racemase
VDSGAAIARRTAWLLEHEAPDAKSTDANIAFCMAITKRLNNFYPFYAVMALKRSKNWRCSTVLSKKETVESFFKRGVVNV